jgi:hypothetical protein
MSGDDVDDETMLTLQDAARIFFPGGNVTENTLKLSVRQGKLVAYRIGKKYWTTARDVREMRSKAKVKPSTPLPTAAPDTELASQRLDAALNEALARKRRK